MAKERDFVNCRLHQYMKPLNYDIRLHPDLSTFKINGFVDITVSVTQEISSVQLNVLDIIVKNVEYEKDGISVPAEVDICQQETDQIVSFNFQESLTPTQNGHLKITFLAELKDNMQGFYRSKYKDSNGVEKFHAVTQFEATQARRAFPCWDDPAVKATFDVRLVATEGHVALSNMPEESSVNLGGGLREVKFQRTPIMSTYLVAFVVGEFGCLDSKDYDKDADVQVRIFTPLGRELDGMYAMKVGLKALPYYNEYFKIAYPLPKLDMIAVPDFAAGAMENWGLMTYRESTLLVSESSPPSQRQHVCLIVGHEVSHQWFGNLVTMDWWSDLWLKEGFATWIEYLCVDYCFPEYHIWTQFQYSEFAYFLTVDSLKSSHPIQATVNHPDEIDEIFDGISYSKGACVIRMLHSWLGQELFREGLNKYLTKHQYSNAVTADLWHALGEVSNLPVDKVMSSWTLQDGYPLVSVRQERKGSSLVLHFEQTRFLADGSSDGEGRLWLIPLQVTSSINPGAVIASTLMQEKTSVLTIPDFPEDGWIKINPGGVGCYRVRYVQEEVMQNLLKPIQCKILCAVDRLSLISDVFALAIAGHVNTQSALTLASAYVAEDNSTVWAELLSSLDQVHSLVMSECDDTLTSASSKFILKLISPIARKLGWDTQTDDDHNTCMLRPAVLCTMGYHGDPDTVKEAHRRFILYATKQGDIESQNKGAIFSTVIHHYNNEVLESLLQLYRDAGSQEESMRILRVLGRASLPDVQRRVLDFLLSSEVRDQDSPLALPAFNNTIHGQKLLVNYVLEHWDEFLGRYRSSHLLSHIVAAVCRGFSSSEKADEIQKFFSTQELSSAKQQLEQSLESVRLRGKWRGRDMPIVRQFLLSQKY